MTTKLVGFLLFFTLLLLSSCGSKSPEFEAGSVEHAQKLIEAKREAQRKNAEKLKKQAMKRNLQMQTKAVRKSIKRNAKRQKKRMKRLNIKK
jgi:non-homologous end joining protein Ku